MNMTPSIFSGEKILSGGGLFAGPPDPLAGIPALLDLRTHKGDKIPFGINPATSGTNPLWQGITGAGSQAVSSHQPLTKFATDGTPYLDFDGVDDWMSVGVQPEHVWCCVLARSHASEFFNNYSSFIDGATAGDFDIPKRWAIMENPGDRLHYNPTAYSLRINGVTQPTTTTPFPQPLDVFRTYTILTNSASVGERGIAQYAQNWFLNADIIAMLLMPPGTTNDQLEEVEAYFEALKPNELADIPMVMHLKMSGGLYKDAAFTEPATEDGDLIYHWRDEDTGVSVSQSSADYRPILRIDPDGRRSLDFHPQKALINYNLPIVGDMGWAILAKLTSAVGPYARALSFRAPGVTDHASLATICAVLRDAGSDAVGAYYNGERQGWSDVALGEWFTDVTRKTNSQITVQINDLADQVTDITGSLNSSMVIIGGQDAALDSWNSLIADVLIGPWSTEQTARVRHYIESRRAEIL